MKKWNELSARQRRFVQTSLNQMIMSVDKPEPGVNLLGRNEKAEALRAALDVLAEATMFEVTKSK